VPVENKKEDSLSRIEPNRDREARRKQVGGHNNGLNGGRNMEKLKIALCQMRCDKCRKQWELPAGIIDNDETSRQCAVRELFEQTNQTVDIVRFRGLMNYN
jgi:8-oxo-dGTP pyrophosphatase MutT (NUDIX family)